MMAKDKEKGTIAFFAALYPTQRTRAVERSLYCDVVHGVEKKREVACCRGWSENHL